MTALLQSDCPDLSLVARGKVRDLYAVDAEHLLVVSTDRLSAFDVVMTNGVPGKGKILTQLSLFWFDLLARVCPHHLVTGDIDAMPAAVRTYSEQLRDRVMLVRRLEILPVEAIVRGYLSGSGWREYQRQGTVCDLPLPEGMVESQQLPAPLYTPSTKAAIGGHDENIHPDRAAEIIGAGRGARVADLARQCYETGRDFARQRGIIIADTKFEFGVDGDGIITLADEVLTPDSSRFWPADRYQPGGTQPSFDKQPVRDHLAASDFDGTTPVALPQEVIDQTLMRYVEVYRRLTGAEPRL
jgi:phosphoribosylaminoimidazole-succinocarboxamide synthase